MIICGDSLEVLKTLDANSVDAVVTDPPYGLSFMGKKWDYDVPSTDLWIEVLRVLKPGGHLLSFGGTRTYHRLVIGIEHAGFEIRDQVQWIYGSGFPKSLDVSKAIDKAAGAEREVVGCWQGFGTALKPANEPIVLARKPLSESTVAKNVLRWGTGALNIDGTRIASEANRPTGLRADGTRSQNKAVYGEFNPETIIGANSTNQGRWPANVLFDEEAAAMLDEQSGQFKGSIGRANRKSAGNYEATSFKVGVVTETEVKDFGGASRFFYVAKASKRERNAGLEGMPEVRTKAYEGGDIASAKTPDSPGGKRTSANHHPTVKPVKLMEYLCKLITPPGGTILDPFCGSGSTGVAAINLGFKFIGIEREKEYVEIANKRLEHASKKEEQLEL